MLITGWFTWLLVNRVIKRELDAARKRESMLNSAILTIAHMVDARDIYTAEHAALLHDIGKVGIPDGILNKKGKLSLEEFRKGCGTQFDPKLCNSFLSLMENGKVTDDNPEPSSNNISLPQIFERFGGRYSVIQARLKSDVVIRQFIHEFLEDDQFEKLKQALEAGDDRAAFAAVHTMKGIALNLEMENLARLCMALTENLRNDSIHPRTWDLFTQVEQEYNEVCALIHQMEQV